MALTMQRSEIGRTIRAIVRWREPDGRKFDKEHLELLYRVIDAFTSDDLDFDSFTMDGLVTAARMVVSEDEYQPQYGEENVFLEAVNIRDAITLFEGFKPTVRDFGTFI